MSKDLHVYSYDGPVKSFDTIVDYNWKAQTMASSEMKARSNLAYQWKRENGKVASYKVTLPGKITTNN